MRAIVVGSGAAGATVARLLARSGRFTVLVLEKGRNLFLGLGQGPERVTNLFANDEIAYEVRLNPINQDPVLEPRSFRRAAADGARAYVGDVNDLPVTVGGGTVHYDAKARRFREVDFVTNSLLGGTADRPAIPGTTYADWPMEYRHLEPFYAVVEEIVGVQGPAYRSRGRVVNPNPNESWRSTPFPLPPGVGMYSNLIQAEAAARLGYHPAPVPTAIVSRPYRGRPACVDCAHCLSFGCPINAKSGAIWQLDEALATGRVELRSQCNVIRLEIDDRRTRSGRFRVRGVTYVDAGGRLHTELADLVILANSPIEAVRLSLLSGIGRGPDDAAPARLLPTETEPSGLLGRNLMFHLQTTAIAIFNTDIHPWRGRTSSHTLDDFAGAGPSPDRFDPTVPRGGIVELGGNIDPITEAVNLQTLAFGALHKELMRLSPVRRHLAALAMQGEDMPQLTNYVDLDPDIVDIWGQPVPRITYQNHPYEIAAAAHYVPKLLEILEAIGGPSSPWPSLRTLVAAPLGRQVPSVIPQSLQFLDNQLPFSDVPQSRHIMGTHRMALDSEHGPCNPYGRYWAFDNLYHAGGGLYVTAPGFNVTLTIWALAYWMATAILAEVDGAQAYDRAAIDANWQRQLCVLRDLDPDTMIAHVLGGPCAVPQSDRSGAVRGIGVGALPDTDAAAGGASAVSAAAAVTAVALGSLGAVHRAEAAESSPDHGTARR